MTTLADRFRAHAVGCDELGAPLYAVLLRGMADDWENSRSGVVRTIFAGWEDAPSVAVVQLRVLGGLHRLVLTGQAPALVPYYRNLGGTRPPETAWPVARDVMADHVDTLRDGLGIVPQTNEVGRSAALLAALFAASTATGLHRIRLLEVGASAGLNLLVDHFRFTSGPWSWGPADAPVVIEDAVAGDIRPAAVEIVQRRGCDLNPIDPTTDAGRLRLRSFVWPDHVERYRRLDAAFEAALRTTVVVDRAPAVPWLVQRLAEPVDPGVLTLVWHSVVWQYLTPGERSDAEAALRAAAARVPLVHAAMEPPYLELSATSTLTVTTYDGGTANSRVLGDVPAHGVPVRLA